MGSRLAIATFAVMCIGCDGALGQRSDQQLFEQDEIGHQINLLEMEGDYAGLLALYDRLVKVAPDDRDLAMRRGSAYFRAGYIEESLADFDRIVRLSPQDEPYLWQRGIAQYYAGQFDECAAQFVVHRTVNPADVENAAWHYLCVAASEDAATARAGLLPVGPDARIPMKEVYELFAGRLDVPAVIAAAEAANWRQRPSAMFYAYLYVGLWHEAHGREQESARAIAKAVELSGLPPRGYMGDVAVVHQRVRER